MTQEKDRQKEEIYEINNKKYVVITKCIENSEDINKLYEVLCKFAISKLD